MRLLYFLKIILTQSEDNQFFSIAFSFEMNLMKIKR
jgi:hypothetical protein